MGGSSNLGPLLLGLAAGSVLTAVAAYVVTASDLARLRKENKRLQQEQQDGVGDDEVVSRSVSVRSAAAAIAASG